MMQQLARATAVLHAGRGDEDDQQQTQSVDQTVALAPVDVLPCVVPH
jgi:hypothetical protein